MLKSPNTRILAADMTLVFVTAIWGLGFIAIENAINAHWGPALITAGRFAVAAAALGVVMAGKIRKITPDEWKYGSLAGLILLAAFYVQTIGQAMTTVSNAAFITATNVVMVPFISWAINKDKPRLRIILLALTALAGVAVLSYKNGKLTLGAGDLLVLLCAGLFALHITWLEKATRGRSPAAINFVQIVTAAIGSFGVLLARGIQAETAGIEWRSGIWPVLFLGLLSTCLCFFLQTNAQKYTTAAQVGVILSLEGFFGSFFAVLLGFEPLSASLIIGGVLIISAAILVAVKVPERWRDQASFNR
jgi:drug/metabolite transporter (DMT)-like permease